MEARRQNQVVSGGSIPASELFFRLGEIENAEELVSQYHYSHRFPNCLFIGTFHVAGGLFGDCGPAIAACCFGMPGTRWSEPVLELNRLVRKPHCRVPLSLLVKLTVGAVRRNGKYDLLVSFADKTQGHEGYIYRACCWHYHGCRSRSLDGVVCDGVFVPGRTCNSRWGTRSPDKLSVMLKGKHEIEPHYDEGKHLYWKTTGKTGNAKAARLKLEKRNWVTAR